MLDGPSLKTWELPGMITAFRVEKKTVCLMTKSLMNDELSAGQKITSLRQMREVVVW